MPKLNLTKIEEMGYPPYEGMPDLVNHVKGMLKNYEHVLITNGTTSSINIVLKALVNNEGRRVVVTNKHYFPYYPNIIEHAFCQHKTGIATDTGFADFKMNLLDAPSNPWGAIVDHKDIHNNTIWDSVYASKIYINSLEELNVGHRVNVGSFSKILGIAGLRLGWIATNSKKDYDLFYAEQQYSLCGVSMLGQDLLTDILDTVDFDLFCTRAKFAVNSNREEFLKLGGFFDNQQIPSNGMFYPVWVDDKALTILERAGVGYMKLDTEGQSTLIRFNLAQNRTMTKDAIKAIKTADRITKRSK